MHLAECRSFPPMIQASRSWIAYLRMHKRVRAAPTESWRYCRRITEARAEEDFPFRFVYGLLSGRGNLSPVTDTTIMPYNL